MDKLCLWINPSSAQMESAQPASLMQLFPCLLVVTRAEKLNFLPEAKHHWKMYSRMYD